MLTVLFRTQSFRDGDVDDHQYTERQKEEKRYDDQEKCFAPVVVRLGKAHLHFATIFQGIQKRKENVLALGFQRTLFISEKSLRLKEGDFNFAGTVQLLNFHLTQIVGRTLLGDKQQRQGGEQCYHPDAEYYEDGP